MALIPLHIHAKQEYPLTPKSTVHYWATQAFYHDKGPFKGKIRRVGRRWYISLEEDPVVMRTINIAKEILGGD